jgi:hypothetical protein
MESFGGMAGRGAGERIVRARGFERQFHFGEENPGDFDLLFLYDADSEARVQQDEDALALIDPIRCKARFGGDVFAYSASVVAMYPQFFPTDSFDHIKFTNVKKAYWR